MASERTDVGIAWRLAAIGCLWAALTWAWQRPQSFVVAMICAAVTVWLVVSLVRFVGRSERELARFVESVGHGDATQHPCQNTRATVRIRTLAGRARSKARLIQLAQRWQRTFRKFSTRPTFGTGSRSCSCAASHGT